MNGDKNKLIEIDGDPILAAINTLPRVSAPDGFEHSVAREIRSRSGDNQKEKFPWLKVAVPTAALALLAAFFGLSSISTNDMPTVTVVDDPNGRSVTTPEVGRDERVADTRDIDQRKNSKDSTDQEKELNVRRSTSENVGNSVDLPSRGGTDGSTDSAAGSPSRPILPRGLDPESKPATNARGVGQTTTVKVTDIVQTLGIRAVVRDNQFMAESVSPNSQALRAGVRAGDVIEAVNDVAFTSNAILTGRVDVRSIRVRRGGRSITLKL